jgi:hypothetical protein
LQEIGVPKESRVAALHLELAELYQRARIAIDESRRLQADREFILWWRGMQLGRGTRREDILDD